MTKPVLILRFNPAQAPGYFSEFLDEHAIPWVLVRVDEDEPIPSDAAEYSGIGLMGGPMSVNDPLPWIPGICGLLRDAFVKDIPMIGHCLGGQLMSKALGGRVQKNPVMELGWGEVFPSVSEEANKWFGELSDRPLTVFQWHGETFSIPMQAKLIATGSYCQNQIVTFGPHLAMQCHVEMTAELISLWCRNSEGQTLANGSSVQTSEEIVRQVESKMPELKSLANRLYTEWISNLHT